MLHRGGDRMAPVEKARVAAAVKTLAWASSFSDCAWLKDVLGIDHIGVSADAMAVGAERGVVGRLSDLVEGTRTPSIPQSPYGRVIGIGHLPNGGVAPSKEGGMTQGRSGALGAW